MQFKIIGSFDLNSLFKIREIGIQTVEKVRRRTDKPTCNSQVHNFESVRIIDCYAAFLVLCYGMAAALLIFCIEVTYKTTRFCLEKRHN